MNSCFCVTCDRPYWLPPNEIKAATNMESANLQQSIRSNTCRPIVLEAKCGVTLFLLDHACHRCDTVPNDTILYNWVLWSLIRKNTMILWMLMGIPGVRHLRTGGGAKQVKRLNVCFAHWSELKRNLYNWNFTVLQHYKLFWVQPRIAMAFGHSSML